MKENSRAPHRPHIMEIGAAAAILAAKFMYVFSFRRLV